jgi:hypothetical protein
MPKLTFSGPTRETAAEAARAAAVLAGDAAHVHVIPAEKIIRVYTGADVVTFDPRPTVSKWQFVQACVDAGITEAQLDAAVALLTPNGNDSGGLVRQSTGTTHSRPGCAAT